MRRNIFFIFILFCLLAKSQPYYDLDLLTREKLNRGLVAFRQDKDTVCVSWRLLPEDTSNLEFNLYRDSKKLNIEPLSIATFYKDVIKSTGQHSYSIKKVVDGEEEEQIEAEWILPADAPWGFLEIPLNIPPRDLTPDGQPYTYSPNDVSIGDVDADGQYEIFLKWTPSNSKDNSHDGYTGSEYIDCYCLTGELLWRINLGKNIRSGAHYTPFMVFDLDGDNQAELVMRTADGTIDGIGQIIGDTEVDARETNGRILDGKDYLTVFSGLTGEALYTVEYIPQRGNPLSWGDPRSNRSDRFLACVAYLNGINPSVVFCRGYYTRTVLAAYDWSNGKLTQRWVFDSDEAGNKTYAGQGFHSLRVGDVDGDGYDEIIYGSCTIDHDGHGLYSSKLGHGDALHLTAFIPDSPFLQLWSCHENKKDGSALRDMKTDTLLYQLPSNKDVGRAMAADIDPTSPGVEMWSLASGGIRNYKGEIVNENPSGLSCNMAVWWDGDLLRELLDKTSVSKYNWEKGECYTIFSAKGCTSINGTKANPCLQADIIGDWREELLFASSDKRSLRIYISPFDTPYRVTTFLADPIYRISVATQNVGYNQPTQLGFYFGPDVPINNQRYKKLITR